MRTRAAALFAATVVTGATLAACGTDDDASVEDAADVPTSSQSSQSSEPTSAAPTPSETASESASASGTPAATVAVPAYFVGRTPQGQRLFREFRDVSADAPVDEALALVAAGDALDPDYSTLLPAGTLTSAGGLVVSLPDASWAQRPAGMSAKDATLAVQQVVHTVQGVQQSTEPVRFELDGAPSPVLGIDTADGVKAGKFTRVLALVNVTAPAEGDAVSGTFTASGVASSFEGTVPWEVRDGSGTAVLDGFSQADGWIDALYPWETSVDVSSLAPGTYTFVAMTDDPSGGEGGGPTEDTRTITVQ